MKKLNQFGKISFMWVILPLIAVMMISSCSKNDDEDELSGEAQIMVVNAASGSASQDFFLDNAKVNAEAVAYSESSAYAATPAGYSRKGEFRNSGSATANFTGYVDILPNRKYTVFYTSTAEGTDNSSAIFSDETATSTSKAKVRFVNLASGLAAANLAITGGANLATNIAFGTGSTFNEVDPGTVTLQTSLASGGTTSVNLGSFTMQAGKIYTLYTSGSLTSTVSAKLITHN